MRTIRSSCFTLLILLSLAGSLSAATFTGGGFTIFDAAGRSPAGCSTVGVSGIVASGRVTSISYKGFSHTWLGDSELRVYLPGAAPPPSIAANESFIVSSPPDARPCSFAGDYRFIDSATQTLDDGTNGCGDTGNAAPGDYRTSGYGGGGASGSVTSLASSPGVLAPAQLNGTWLVCAFDFDTPDSGSVAATEIVITPIAPTAAKVTVSGRVVDPDSKGLRNAVLRFTDINGGVRTGVTSAMGYFSVPGLDVGEYTINIDSRRFKYQTRVISIRDHLSGLVFKPER